MKAPWISATDAALRRIEQVRVNRKQPQAGFPEIHDVRDTTDHAQGANPYYQPAKK